MLSFLFWNIGKNPLQHRVARMASHFGADFVMLAECPVLAEEVLQALNAIAPSPYHLPPSLGRRIQLFTRLSAGAVTEEFNSSRMTIRHINPTAPSGVLLAVAHFPSRGLWDDKDQTLWATVPAQDVRRVEQKTGHARTVLVGDLNMNPFDAGIIGAHALHAVMSRDLAERGGRQVDGEIYPFFYNPMWGSFGDRTPGPPGTFFLTGSKPGSYFWNMYDQVLLRPALMDRLQQLQILDSDGYESLVTKAGRPKKSDCSDHLPLLFRLDV